MATNKNATIRYQALDKLFRNPGRRYFIEDLIEVCNEALLDVDPHSSGIKRRQVYEDIKFMKDSRGFDAPIESYKDGRKAYYRYTDINFSINNQPLNEQEAQQLKESLMTISRFKGMPQFDWVEEIKVRLEQSFNLKSEDKVLSFDANPFLIGREHIGDLYNAIIAKQTLYISYKPFTSEDVIQYELHPYYLKQYNNRWFLWGYNDKYKNLTNIALDRIVLIKASDTTYRMNTDIDFDEFFEDVIGVSIPLNEEPQKILLKVDSTLWPYIKTKPLHGSQKVKEETKEYTIIQLELLLNYELESLILSFGEKMLVVEPESLRTAVKERVNNLFNNYR